MGCSRQLTSIAATDRGAFWLLYMVRKVKKDLIFFIPVLSVTSIPCVLASQHNKAYPQFNIQQDWKNYIYKQFLQVIHHRRWARRCRRRWTRRSPLRGSHGHQSRLEGPPGGPLEFYCLLCLSSKEIQKQLKFVSVAVKVKRKEGGR